MKSFKSILASCIIFIFSLCMFVSCTPSKDPSSNNKDVKTLTVYSGAGLKKPMEEIAKEFEGENKVKIEYIFAGSSQLLSQLEMSGKGDVFIVGSMNAYESAKKKNLVDDCKTVANHTPVIGVQRGNPKNIKTLNDLENENIKVILGDEKAAAIGTTTQEIIKKNNLTKLNDKAVAKTATINELTMHLSSGDVDAAIITRDSAHGNSDVDIIEIPENQNVNQVLPIAAVTSSKEKDLAVKFVDFVSSDKGKAIFEKYGFTPVK